MPYRYSLEFRRKVLDLLADRRPVASIAADLDVSEQTVYTWRRQEMIDRGKEPGLTSGRTTRELVAMTVTDTHLERTDEQGEALGNHYFNELLLVLTDGADVSEIIRTVRSTEKARMVSCREGRSLGYARKEADHGVAATFSTL